MFGRTRTLALLASTGLLVAGLAAPPGGAATAERVGTRSWTPLTASSSPNFAQASAARTPDGLQHVVWIVDEGASSWLHSAGADWLARFEGDPVVELERAGAVRRYRAHAAPGPHPEVDRLLREKYGLADRWVRTLAPDDEDTVAVRLDPL